MARLAHNIFDWIFSKLRYGDWTSGFLEGNLENSSRISKTTLNLFLTSKMLGCS